FKSKVTGDLIMLEPTGRRILEIIGKGGDACARGIVLPEDMAAAIAALEQALLQEQAARAPDVQAALAAGQGPMPGGAISLKQRALPFLDMLRRCQKANKEIVWGV
ncbi:MAG: DUF1840 domain-containing protein, partial [Betaproteobacteria bacterium]